jgi:hypothetical protein
MVVVMPMWLILLIVIPVALLVGGTLYSAVPDRIRKSDPNSAETLDQIAMTFVNPRALPMHDRAFDPPR